MENKRVSVALGTFDGLHKAHKKILENALKIESSLCITFKTPPKADGFIMQPELKQKKLLEMGFSEVVMLDFEEVRDLSGEDFLKNITEKYKITDFFVGYDYRFGKNGKGDTSLLSRFCEERGLGLSIEAPVKQDGEIISSSAIRTFLKEGNIAKAISFLGFCPEFCAPVLHGDERGRLLGFPTINQALPSGLCDIKFGVYGSQVLVNGKSYKSITDIGIRPTFPLKTPICETHIIDFNGDLYGENIELSLCNFLRAEKKFASPQELITQINKDIHRVSN